MLHVERYGTGGAPLLIVHGLFGSARNWGAIARRMGESREVAVPDMRNHGASPWTDTHSYHDLAGDLDPLAGGDVIGHSMGGKAAMALALTQPSRVKRLVIADIAPVAYGHTQTPLIEAMRGIDLSQIETRGDADRRLARSVDDPGVRAFLLQSLDVRARAWRLNLDTLEAEMDGITGWTEIDGVFEGPTLFLSGAESTYVERGHRDKIRTHFPAARFAAIPGAGHWLHAEKPREFQAAVEAFFTMTDGASGP
ncbi:MAG: alpha/beta fold hydrolase [Paracoccaceae bacterium]|nr:alpha/beta fold hydrolase [Paracoccaceae bacterium]